MSIYNMHPKLEKVNSLFNDGFILIPTKKNEKGKYVPFTRDWGRIEWNFDLFAKEVENLSDWSCAVKCQYISSKNAHLYCLDFDADELTNGKVYESVQTKIIDKLSEVAKSLFETDEEYEKFMSGIEFTLSNRAHFFFYCNEKLSEKKIEGAIEWAKKKDGSQGKVELIAENIITLYDYFLNDKENSVLERDLPVLSKLQAKKLLEKFGIGLNIDKNISNIKNLEKMINQTNDLSVVDRIKNAIPILRELCDKGILEKYNTFDFSIIAELVLNNIDETIIHELAKEFYLEEYDEKITQYQINRIRELPNPRKLRSLIFELRELKQKVNDEHIKALISNALTILATQSQKKIVNIEKFNELREQGYEIIDELLFAKYEGNIIKIVTKDGSYSINIPPCIDRTLKEININDIKYNNYEDLKLIHLAVANLYHSFLFIESDDKKIELKYFVKILNYFYQNKINNEYVNALVKEQKRNLIDNTLCINPITSCRCTEECSFYSAKTDVKVEEVLIENNEIKEVVLSINNNDKVIPENYLNSISKMKRILSIENMYFSNDLIIDFLFKQIKTSNKVIKEEQFVEMIINELRELFSGYTISDINYYFFFRVDPYNWENSYIFMKTKDFKNIIKDVISGLKIKRNQNQLINEVMKSLNVIESKNKIEGLELRTVRFYLKDIKEFDKFFYYNIISIIVNFVKDEETINRILNEIKTVKSELGLVEEEEGSSLIDNLNLITPNSKIEKDRDHNNIKIDNKTDNHSEKQPPDSHIDEDEDIVPL